MIEREARAKCPIDGSDGFKDIKIRACVPLYMFIVSIPVRSGPVGSPPA